MIPNFFTPNKPKRSREEVRRDLGRNGRISCAAHVEFATRQTHRSTIAHDCDVRRTGSRIRLFILAGGPFDPYEPLLDELGLRDIVIVRQNMAVVEEYLEAADAGLYTSEYESFGLSILETVFHGKPVVAFRVGGIPEVLGDSYPLYPFGDVTAAAAALDALVAISDSGARTRRTRVVLARAKSSQQIALFLNTKRYIAA